MKHDVGTGFVVGILDSMCERKSLTNTGMNYHFRVERQLHTVNIHKWLDFTLFLEKRAKFKSISIFL